MHLCGGAVQAGSGTSHRIHELEKELGRLREDGHAYREDLRQQLETARQAATQARHDAAQSQAAAWYEASRLQQLQDDKAVTDSMVASWKQQGREQQVRVATGMVVSCVADQALIVGMYMHNSVHDLLV